MSGDVSTAAEQVTGARLVQTGAVPTNTNGAVAELQKTWNCPNAPSFAEIYASIAPDYAAVIESHLAAAAAASAAGRMKPPERHGFGAGKLPAHLASRLRNHMSYERLTSINAALLLVDHQTGLSNGVQD